MSFNKSAVAINLFGTRQAIVNEINKLFADPINGFGLQFTSNTERYQNIFLPELINFSLMRVVYYSRSWKNIDPIIFQSIIENSFFLNIEGNMFAIKLPYYESLKQFSNIVNNVNYEKLEDMLLAEFLICFPYIYITDAEKIKIQTIIEHLVNTFIYEIIFNNSDAQILLNHFRDNYVEIFINKMSLDSYTVLIHREMNHYIQILAQKEEEMLQPTQRVWGNPVVYPGNSILNKFAYR